MTLGRRAFIGGSCALAAACATPALRGPARPLGLANITVRKELAADYAGTLRRVAEIGYTHFGFPLAAMSPRQPPVPPPADQAAMIRDAGMEPGVVRLGLAEPAAAQMEAAAKLGAGIVAYTAAPVFFRSGELGVTTREAFDAWLPELGEIAALASANGLRLAYHNHWWDHVPLGDASPLDLIERTYAPGEVGFEIDLAWAHIGGADPAALVERLGARVLSLHFKDVDPTRGSDRFAQLVPPGEGVLGYDAILPRIDRATSAIGYVEVDAPPNGMAAARTGFAAVDAARTI